MEKRDEVERGLFYGLRCVFSPLLKKIRDTTLPEMECNINEHFSYGINFNIPEEGSHVPYQNEFILNKLGIDSEFETAYRFEQTSDTVSRTFYFIQKNFSTYVIIDFENLKEPVEWKIEGKEVKTISSNNEKIFVLPHVRITAKSPVTAFDKGFIFNLANGQTKVLLHIETVPLYKEFERTVIIADSSQVNEIAAVLSFFSDHKYVPIIFFENKDNEILRINANTKELKEQHKKINEQRKEMLVQIVELHPENIIMLINSTSKIEDIISPSMYAKVHQLTNLTSGNCIPLEELVERVSIVFHKNYTFISVENYTYLAAACLLARIKGASGKVIIPIVQSRAEHELRIGTAGYGGGEYCGELTEVTRNIMHMIKPVPDEGVLVEYDGTGQSIMRSILASNYAYMNHTVPVIIEKVNVVDEIKDINRDLKVVSGYYKFIEFIKCHKTKILNEEVLKSSERPLDIKTLDFLNTIEVNNEISPKEIEEYGLNTTLVGIDEYGLYLPDGPIEKIKDKLLKVSEKITASLGNSIQILDDFKYLTVFTDGTPYNLAKCGDEFWATRFALGHFVEDECQKAAAILINLLMYSKGREYPIKRILQVAPYANEHSMFKFTRQDDAFAITKIDTGEVKRKWALVFELINDRSDKETVIEFGKYISWFNMHFGTHGSGSSIRLRENAELKLDEIMGFNLQHTLIDLNACETYPFVGKDILSSSAAGGYATLFLVKDKTADEIGKGVFHGTLNHKEPSESLRENIEQVVNDGYDGISEFAYVHIGLSKLKPFVRDVQVSEEKHIQRWKYEDMLNIVRTWIREKRKGQDACFENYQKQKEEYCAYIGIEDHEERYSLFFDEGLLEIKRKSFDKAVDMFSKAHDEIKELAIKKNAPGNFRLNNMISSMLAGLIYALGGAGRIDEANVKLQELENISHTFLESEKMNRRLAQGLVNIIYFLRMSRIDDANVKLQELENISLRFPASEKIKLSLAVGLVHIINYLGGAGRIDEANVKLQELENISLCFPTSDKINLRLANGFVHIINYLCRVGRIDEAIEKLQELENISLRFPASENINNEVAGGLVHIIYNLSGTGRIDEAIVKIQELENIAHAFPASEQIQLKFLWGLVHIISNLDGAGRSDEAIVKIQELENIAHAFPASSEINLQFAHKLVFLINYFRYRGRIDESIEKLQELENLAVRFPASEKIKHVLANGLGNIINDLGLTGRIDEAKVKLQELENIAHAFPASEQINIAFGKGLGNSLNYLGEEGKTDEAIVKLRELENIAHAFPASEKINLTLAQGIVHIIKDLGRAGRIDEAKVKVQELETIVHRFPVSEKIKRELARGLKNFTNYHGKANVKLQELKNLALRFPASEKIKLELEQVNLELARELVHIINYLRHSGKIDEAKVKLQELETIALLCPASEKINSELAVGLGNIIKDLGRAGRIDEANVKLQELENISLRFPASEKINLELIKRLKNSINYLCGVGRIDEAIEKLQELENISLRFSASKNINNEVAGGLVHIINYLGGAGRINEANVKVQELKNISLRFSASAEINLRFAEGLLKIINDLQLAGKIDEAKVKLQELENISLCFPASEPINIKLVEGLNDTIYYLGRAGRIDEAIVKVQKLENIAHTFPASEKINLILAGGLVHIINYFRHARRIDEAKVKVQELENIALRFPASEKIKLEIEKVNDNVIT